MTSCDAWGRMTQVRGSGGNTLEYLSYMPSGGRFDGAAGGG